MRLLSMRATVVLTVLAVGSAAAGPEPEQVTRAVRMVTDYETALGDVTGGLDALKALERLRPAVPILKSLNSDSVRNKILSRFHPVGSDGVRLSGDEAMKVSERFLQDLSAVSAIAESLDRCVAAIVGSAQEFVLLPLGNALLAKRFLPAATVGALLLTADLTARAATLSPTEVDNLSLALHEAEYFGAMQLRHSVHCDRIVSTYREIRLRDDADRNFIITLDSSTAHRQIKLVPH